MNLLERIYYNANSGFLSAEKLYKKANAIDSDITHSQVNTFIKNQPTAQLTKDKNTKQKFNNIIAPSIRNNYQMDIMYLPNPKLNRGYKYLVTCIDVFSRFIMARPMKTKTSEETLANVESIMNENGFCKNLNVDMGLEFNNSEFNDFCNANNIEVWFSNPEQDNKNAIVERFHRTFRKLILRYVVSSGKPYIDEIPTLIYNYNSTYHNTIQALPIDIWNGKSKNNQTYNRVQYPFKVGDNVRYLLKKKLFEKASSTKTYSEIHTIESIDKNAFYLNDLKKPFRGHELIDVGDITEREPANDYLDAVSEDNRDAHIAREHRKEGIETINIINEPRVRRANPKFV